MSEGSRHGNSGDKPMRDVCSCTDKKNRWKEKERERGEDEVNIRQRKKERSKRGEG